MHNSFLFNEPLFNLDSMPSLDHYLLAGLYQVKSRQLNHVLVIGKDDNGDFIYGEDQDAAELLLVGERLDFRLMPELETISEATAAASAILAEARLSEKNGLVSLPPNCGVELFDVIRVYGSLADDAGVDYRVIGIRFDFNAFTGGFIQKLYLCAV